MQSYLTFILTMNTIRCGPMTKYWCMRFEAKNSRFKDIANRIKNFKNIAKSLANRHQTWSCYMNTTHALNDLVTGPGTCTCCHSVHVCTLNFYNLII